MILKREVEIRNVRKPSYYFQKNIKNIEVQPQRLGGAIRTNSAVLSNKSLLGAVIPAIIGVHPEDTRWYERINNYLDGITLIIPSKGKKFDTSMTFSDADEFKEFKVKSEMIIKQYDDAVKLLDPSKTNTFRVDELALYKHKENSLMQLEDEAIRKTRNGDSIAEVSNNGDYFAWRYMMLHGDVANRQADIKKSNKIRFYIFNATQQKKDEAVKFKAKKQAHRKLAEISDGDNANVQIEAILRLMNKELALGLNIDTMTHINREATLYEQVSNQPVKFMEIIKDSNLKLKSVIEKCISLGLLKRLPTSTVVTETRNNDIIGNNMEEVISYFKNDVNKNFVAQLTTKLKELEVRK